MWAVSAHAVEFPGPVVLPQGGPSLSAMRVRLPGVDRDYFVSGSGQGFLNLYQFNPTSRSYTVLHRFHVGGQVGGIIPWLGLPAQELGLVVAVSNPDHVLFVEVNTAFPYLAIVAEIPLEEDIGGLAFVGNTATGPWELAVTLPGVDQVVFLAESGGVWAVAAMAESGDHPASLVATDLDGDGILELVVANAGPLSGTLGIYRRQPDASYAMEIVSLPGTSPVLVAAHDLDRDGREELAVALSDDPQVVFYTESGSLLVEVDRVDLAVTAQSMHLQDLSDGTPGLFTANSDRGWLEFASFSGGQWTRLDTYYPGCRPHDFTFADLDGNGLDDLVVLGGESAVLASMLGNGAPGFWGFSALSLDLSPGTFANDDMDGDSWRDLLLSNANETTLSLFRGTPDGALSQSSRTWDMGFIPGRILAVELDGDPALELAVLDIIAAELVLLDFSLETGFTLLSKVPVGTFPFYIAAGDLDNDSNMDLLVLTQADPELYVVYGNGGGTVSETLNFGFTNAADRIVPLDLDDDGLLDLVATDGVSRVWTKVNLGARQFGNQLFVDAGAGALYMAPGDLDGDGDADLVVVNRGEPSLSFFENNGSGGLVRRIGGHTLPVTPNGLVLADFDQDGRSDVMLNLSANGTLGLVLGISDWRYSLTEEFVGGPDMSGIDVVDFNLDGVPDILALDRSLQLGLIMVNADPGLVAVAPTALTAVCQGGGLQLRIQPDRPGPWTLDLGRGGAWRQAMVNGQAFVGAADYEGGTWILQIDTEQLTGWVPGPGRALRARLTVGDGIGRESQIWPLDLGCARSGGEPVPRLAWGAEPWPNPFNPLVQARFTIGRAGAVTVAVYDLAGRCVATLAEGRYEAGEHLVQWDGSGHGGPVGAGVYFMRVESPVGVISRKLMLIK